jgi:excisionase family DNA binding protein
MHRLGAVYDMPMHTYADSPLMRRREVETALNVSSSTVYRLIAKGALPSVRVGREYRVPRAALERLLQPTEALD